MTPEQIAEIKADLAAVPAPPWQWIGTKVTGPILTTAHSGWQYLFGPAFPLDERGDQEENADGTPLYADLQFRDEGGEGEYAVMRRATEMIVPRAPYDPDTYRDIDNPMARWIKRSAEHVTALLAEVERLTKDRDHWHDQYQADAGARDQLLAELLDALPGDHAEMLDAYAEVLNGVERLVAELTNERRALAAARKGMATLTARWRQQLRDHGDYATRIADNPDLVATYRDTCTKTGVYDRVIGELDGLLKLVAADEADGGAE